MRTRIYFTPSAKLGNQLLSLLRLGYTLILLAGCQPISPAVEPIVNQPAATLAVIETAVPTEEPKAEVVLALPTSTPTAESPATATEAATDTPTEATSTLTSTPTDEVVLLVPTDTPLPTDIPLPSATLVLTPQISALNSINVRNGPGTDYAIVNGLAAGTQAEVIGKNADASWWQISLADGTTGWVYAALAQFSGDDTTLPVVDVAPPPPTATPIPIPTVVEVNTIVEVNTQAPEAQPIAEAVATEAPAAPPASDGPTFRVIQKRLWDVYENGGRLNGDSVVCGEKRQLVVTVVDPNGIRINGVAVQVVYGAKEIFVTGSQGKGDGTVEFILGSGQDVVVIRDVDGSPATSEVATGLVTRPDVIPYADLIAGKFCTDDASCTHFVNAPGCLGHYSWTVVFQRGY